jgi:hypothetical protein
LVYNCSFTCENYNYVLSQLQLLNGCCPPPNVVLQGPLLNIPHLCDLFVEISQEVIWFQNVLAIQQHILQLLLNGWHILKLYHLLTN